MLASNSEAFLFTQNKHFIFFLNIIFKTQCKFNVKKIFEFSFKHLFQCYQIVKCSLFINKKIALLSIK